MVDGRPAPPLSLVRVPDGDCNRTEVVGHQVMKSRVVLTGTVWRKFPTLFNLCVSCKQYVGIKTLHLTIAF